MRSVSVEQCGQRFVGPNRYCSRILISLEPDDTIITQFKELVGDTKATNNNGTVPERSGQRLVVGSPEPLRDHAARDFVVFGKLMKWSGNEMCRVADFGGNDGRAAAQFDEKFGVAPTVIDCSKERLEYADDTYGLPVIQANLEAMPVATNAFDWGFCHHTLEHLRKPEVCLAEMSRVTRRAIMFTVPMETDDLFNSNPAHVLHGETYDDWVNFILDNGFDKVLQIRLPDELHAIARPHA